MIQITAEVTQDHRPRLVAIRPPLGAFSRLHRAGLAHGEGMMFKMMMCKEATHLMSKQFDASVTFQEKLSLKLHLAMCDACTRCNRQFRLLHQSGKHLEILIKKNADTSSYREDDKT